MTQKKTTNDISTELIKMPPSPQKSKKGINLRPQHYHLSCQASVTNKKTFKAYTGTSKTETNWMKGQETSSYFLSIYTDPIFI
jgi:hypothetical protein